MSLSQMQVFNEYIMPATIETLGQMVDKFNSASNGSIRLTTDGFDGDFLQESFFQAIHTAQRRVDRYATNSAQAATDLTQLKHSSVKIAGGFGPIRAAWLERAAFLGETITLRLDKVRAHDAAANAAAAGAHPWRKVKALILLGYYTSEIGGAQELRYAPLPGRFDPAVPLQPGERAYSNEWTGVEFG